MNNYQLILSQKNDWITLIFLVIFILLVFVKLYYKERLYQLITIQLSKKYFLNYRKEKQIIFNGFNSVLFGVQTLVLTLLVYAFLQFHRPQIVSTSSFLIIKIILVICLLFLVRYLIGKGLSLLFDVKRIHNHMTFAKISYLFSVLLLVLPLLLFVYYSKQYNYLFFQLTMLIFLILLIARYLFIFKINKTLITGHLFYFILYLCALEMAPILIIIKLFNK